MATWTSEPVGGERGRDSWFLLETCLVDREVGCGEALTRRRSLAPCRTRAWVVSVELTVMMNVWEV